MREAVGESGNAVAFALVSRVGGCGGGPEHDAVCSKFIWFRFLIKIHETYVPLK